MDTTSSTPLRAALDEIGWKPEQLVSRINQRRAARGAPPIHHKSGYVWVKGEHQPSPENESDILAVLTARLNRAFTSADLGWAGRSRQRHTRLLDRPCEAGIADLLSEIQGESMLRRRFMVMSGATVTGAALSLLLPGQAAAFQSAENGSRVSSQLIDSITAAVRGLRDLDDSTGSTSGLEWADTLMQGLAKIIRNSSYTDTQAQRLFTAFVELSETYGWMQFDANAHAAAQRLYQTGLCLARDAGPLSAELDDATRNLLASTAYQAAWLGQHAEARTLLEVATRRAGRPLPARLEAVIAERTMYAAGQRGDINTVYAAQEHAHAKLTATGHDGVEQPWWAQWLSSESIDATAGRALLAAGDARAAEPHLTRHVASQEDTYPRDRLVVTLDLARLYQLGGDPVAAATITVQQLNAHPEIDSPRLHTRLGHLATSLAPYRDQAAVQELSMHAAVVGHRGGTTPR